MRRGGRGYHLQVPWRQHDDLIPSSTPFERLEARKFRLLIAIVAFSIAILIFVCNSRRLVVFNRDLQPRTPGLVFPLHSHYIQSPNVSQGETWHPGSRANGRRLRTLAHPFFGLREKIYIEMKLGARAKTYNFNIDTGSKSTWVYCKLPGHTSRIMNVGPHGYFRPGRNSKVKCIGKDSALCNDQQLYAYRPCDEVHNFECLAWFVYADGSRYRGTFVREIFTLPTSNKMEVQAPGVLGCITDKRFVGEVLPFYDDGVMALGTCDFTIVSEWMKAKLINNRIIGICLGRELPRQLRHSRNDVGYVTAGVNLQEKFGVNHFGWAELKNTEGFDCATIATLKYLRVEGKDLHSSSANGLPLVFDTGTELTYLDVSFYALLMDELDFHAMVKGYTAVMHDLGFDDGDQGQCWRAPEDTKISPLQDFPIVTFSIQGMPNSIDPNPIEYLRVQPRNYLEWNENELLLCSNILLADTKSEHNVGESLLGIGQMREHLFEIDPENYRLRWQPDPCDYL